VRIHNPDDASDRAATRNLLKRIASALETTDLIALMMVFVTGLSAYSTWKTAQVTNEILVTSQRPYIGVESVNLVDEANPKVVVDVRNFGSVQAEDATISIVLKVDGESFVRRFRVATATRSDSIITRGTASFLSSPQTRYVPRCRARQDQSGGGDTGALPRTARRSALLSGAPRVRLY
jgi:hypothetical protein